MNVPAMRDDHGRLLPGFSGNPSGPPRVVAQIRDMALKAAPAAFEKVCALVQSVDERIALAVATQVLDRAYGEVPLAGNGGEPVAFVAGGGLGTRSVLPSAICTGLSREPSDGNGWPLARPEAFSAS
jgi:hypothetical protein